MLRWWRWRRLIKEQARPPASPTPQFVQYSARYPDGSRTIYPSEAAYKNDPVWDRSDGALTEGRLVDIDGRARSRWTGVYAKDRKAIRREWDDGT